MRRFCRVGAGSAEHGRRFSGTGRTSRGNLQGRWPVAAPGAAAAGTRPAPRKTGCSCRRRWGYAAPVARPGAAVRPGDGDAGNGRSRNHRAGVRVRRRRRAALSLEPPRREQALAVAGHWREQRVADDVPRDHGHRGWRGRQSWQRCIRCRAGHDRCGRQAPKRCGRAAAQEHEAYQRGDKGDHTSRHSVIGGPLALACAPVVVVRASSVPCGASLVASGRT